MRRPIATVNFAPGSNLEKPAMSLAHPPLVSIILPTFNRSGVLGRAVRSVLQQTFSHFELIVIDDASTDDTLAILRRMRDERIRVIQLPHNRGPAAARNVGLAAAQGEFIAFQDSDDEWLPHKLAMQLEAIQEHPSLGAVGCGRITITRRGPRTFIPERRAQLRYEDLLAGRAGGTGTPLLLVRRDGEDGVWFDERFPAFEERDYILGIAKKAPISFVCAPLVRVYRNLSDHVANTHNAAAGYRAFLAKYSEELVALPSVRAFYEASLGRELALLGETSEARRCFSNALAIEPNSSGWRVLRMAAACGPRASALVARFIRVRPPPAAANA